MKTKELVGKALDWAVQKVLFARQDHTKPWVLERHAAGDPCGSASTDWAQGGPVIERERISTCWEGTTWVATLSTRAVPKRGAAIQYGPTPLVAAMRCLVLATLGEEVELPESLQNNT